MTLDRPKTTGKRGENRHWWGHIRDITAQLDMPPAMMPHVAYSVLMMEAGGLDDWPEEFTMESWKTVGSALAALAIERAHYFADSFGLSLVERDEHGREYRVTY
jgi:hypothetical protein